MVLAREHEVPPKDEGPSAGRSVICRQGWGPGWLRSYFPGSEPCSPHIAMGPWYRVALGITATSPLVGSAPLCVHGQGKSQLLWKTVPTAHVCKRYMSTTAKPVPAVVRERG